MKKSTKFSRRTCRDINVEKINETESKYYIKTSQISAVTGQRRVENYEDYINNKYLTGAIVNGLNRKKSKPKDKEKR